MNIFPQNWVPMEQETEGSTTKGSGECFLDGGSFKATTKMAEVDL